MFYEKGPLAGIDPLGIFLIRIIFGVCSRPIDSDIFERQ